MKKELIKQLIETEVKEALTESKVKILNMTFTVVPVTSQGKLGIKFIPDSKTLDVPKQLQVEAITKAIKKAMPMLSDAMFFKSGSGDSGITFIVNEFTLSDILTNALNKTPLR